MTDEKPKNGLSTNFYINSKQKKSEGEYKDGKQEGRWIEWWINGQKMSEGNYKDGKKDGNWTWWFMEGGNQCVGEYKDGSEVGNWVLWDENGERIFSGDYKDGKKYLNEAEGLKKSIGEEGAAEAKRKEDEQKRKEEARLKEIEYAQTHLGLDVPINNREMKSKNENKGTQTVKISDIDMPFGSMVIFMVKWAIASIPALLILMVLFAIFGGFFLGIISMLN